MNNTVRKSPRGWVLMGMVAMAALMTLALGGCAAEQAAETPTPTKTQMPTFTPAPPTATPTEVPPTATLTPLPSPTEAPTLAPTDTPEPPTPEPTAPPAATATRRPAAKPAPKPVQPTAAPPPPAAAADPCAGIGGDGCKFRVTGGPSFGENGGQELKLQFAFIHSGIDGGQPQGSYFVVLEKDGQKLPISDSVRSVTGSPSQGPARQVQLRIRLGRGTQLPGNTVAGNYTVWVLDGNDERDSRNVTFSVPGNSGLIWIQFDQA